MSKVFSLSIRRMFKNIFNKWRSFLCVYYILVSVQILTPSLRLYLTAVRLGLQKLNPTIWQTVTYFNPSLVTISMKPRISFGYHSEIKWPAADIFPTRQIYVRGIFVEHSHDIFPKYSEKVPCEIPGNIPKIMLREYWI